MEPKRQFIIKVSSEEIKFDTYIKSIYGNRIGYWYNMTLKKKKAKVWTKKKSCQNAIDKLTNLLDPTKQLLKTHSLEEIEITDNITLRLIKLKKLNKKNENR
jgi:hypothetical protein